MVNYYISNFTMKYHKNACTIKYKIFQELFNFEDFCHSKQVRIRKLDPFIAVKAAELCATHVTSVS